MLVRGRLVGINQVVYDQEDFFSSDGYNRVAGLTILDLTCQVFHNNTLVGWPLQNGSTVPDSKVVSGYLYFHEIAGAPGNYGLRFRPNTTGYWRVVLSYEAGEQVLGLDLDVVENPPLSNGLRSRFVE